jgi:hypothetical protein
MQKKKNVINYFLLPWKWKNEKNNYDECDRIKEKFDIYYNVQFAKKEKKIR